MKKLLLLLLLSLPCFAQNMRFDAVVWGPKGPVPNATVAVCTQPATTTTTPCSPLASLCSSLTDNVCSSPNPVTADSLGNYHFYAKTAVGPYTVQIYGPQVAVPYLLTDQYLNGTLVSPTLSSATLITPSIGGETLSAVPRLTWTSYGGVNTNNQAIEQFANASFGLFKPDKAITVTRVQVNTQFAPAGCTTAGGVVVTDGTTVAATINFSNGTVTYDSGALSVNYPAADTLNIQVTNTAASGCSPYAQPMVTVQYKMQ